MAKRDKTREALERLAICKTDPTSKASRDEIRKALGGRISVAVARAANLIREHNLSEFEPEMEKALTRLMKAPTRDDKGCTAKLALIEALDAMEFMNTAPFLAGVTHVQLEPVYGGKVDTAAELRSRCAAALVRLRHPDAFRYVCALLHDPWPEARIGAVAAARYAGNEWAELLLRSKALAGDEDARVVGDSLAALAEMAPTEARTFLPLFLKNDDEDIADYAALALGETRDPGAFPILKETWQAWGPGERRHSLLLPMALLRCDEGFAFLVRLVGEAPVSTARAALHALESARANPDLVERIRAAVSTRTDDALAGEASDW